MLSAMRPAKALLASLGVLLAAAFPDGPARAAMEPRSVAEALAIGFGGTGDAAYSNATIEGTQTIISDLVVRTRDDGSVSIGRAVITNAVAQAGGGFTADRVAYETMRTSSRDPDTKVVSRQSTASTVLEAVSVLGANEANPLLGRFVFASASGRGVSFSSSADSGVFNADGFVASIDAAGRRAVYRLDRIVLPQAPSPFPELGYNTLTASLTVSGSYEPNAKLLKLDEFSLTLPDLGKFSFTGNFVSPPLEKFADPTLTDAGRALLLYTSTTLTAATIRIENGGLVERALELGAKNAKVSRQAFTDQLRGAVPLTVGSQIKDPAFRASAVQALTAFLQNPRSLVLTAVPRKPLPLAELMVNTEVLPDLFTLNLAAGN